MSFDNLQFSPYKPFSKRISPSLAHNNIIRKNAKTSSTPQIHDTDICLYDKSKYDQSNYDKSNYDKSNYNKSNYNNYTQIKRFNSKLYCKNCKSNDHNVHTCKQPIFSYGLVIFEDQSYKKVLLIQRKDTYAYIALVGSDEYLSFAEIARKITREERNKILTMDFEALWNDVMSATRMCHNKKLMYQKKSLFEFNKIKDIVANTDINELPIEPQWSFPKGRLKSDETTLECAIRETCEETYLKPHDIVILSEKSFSETYVGDDNKTYINVYYFAELLNNSKFNKSNTPQPNEFQGNKFQSNETRQCKFVPVNELKFFFIENKKLNKSKKAVIKQIKNQTKKQIIEFSK